MSDNFNQYEDFLVNSNSDKYKKVTNGGPLFFDVTFYKKFDTIRDPETGKLVDMDVITCFEFPQFACLVEVNTTVDNEADDSWKAEILKEFIEYLKIKAASFAKMFVGSSPSWINDVTVRFSVTTA